MLLIEIQSLFFDCNRSADICLLWLWGSFVDPGRCQGSCLSLGQGCWLGCSCPGSWVALTCNRRFIPPLVWVCVGVWGGLSVWLQPSSINTMIRSSPACSRKIISSLQKCVRNHQLYWFLPRHITLQCEGSLRGFSPYKTLRFGSVPKICFFCETCDKHCFSLLHTKFGSYHV